MALAICAIDDSKINTAIINAFSGYNCYSDEVVELLVNELINSLDQFYPFDITHERIEQRIFGTLKHIHLLLLFSIAINIFVSLKSHFILFGNYITKISIPFLQRKQDRADDHSFTNQNTVTESFVY